MHSADICYVCGCQGKTEIVHTRPLNGSNNSNSSGGSKIPWFPSLLLVPAAPGSKPPSPADGHVRLCVLCFRLLLEQWKSYEKRKTPLPSRQYWLKCCTANRDSSFESGGGTNNSVCVSRSSITTGDDRQSDQQTAEDMMMDVAAVDQGRSNRRSVSSSSIGGGGGTDDAAQQDAGNRRKPVATSGGKSSNSKESAAADAKSLALVCVVCRGDIESVDVCRRLPAHIVAHVAQLSKPNLTQTTSGNLTGEALVCDDCFASASFQSAWLECCRRGGGGGHGTVVQAQSQIQAAYHHSKPSRRAAGSTTTAPDHATPPAGLSRQNSNNSAATGSLISEEALADAQRQWLVLYERALMQFHFNGGRLDPAVFGQLQQLAAAETLASMQHSGSAEDQRGDR